MAINSLSYTSNGLSGLISGMDTESMVEKLLAGTQAKIDAQKQKKTVLEYKQEMYRDLSSKLKTLQSTFFSYSNPTSNLYSDSLFDNMKASSSSSALKVTASSTAGVGKMTINEIKQLATATTVSSKGAVSSTLEGSFAVAKLTEFANSLNKETLTVTMDNVSKTINLKELAGKTNAEAVTKLNELFEKAGIKIKASFENSNFVLTSTQEAKEKAEDGSTVMESFRLTASSDKGLALFASSSSAIYSDDKGKMDVGLDTSALLPSFSLSLDGGASKTISFDIFDENGATLTDINAVAQNLNESLAKAFGQAVRVEVKNGKFSFGTYDSNGNVDASHQITMTGSASTMDILGIKSNSSNKINTGMKLGEANFATALTPGENGNYSFSINGYDFEFAGDTTIANIIQTVNSSKAGVKLSYSGVDDKFTLQSTVTGAGGLMEMEETGGNLLSAMFGKNEEAKIDPFKLLGSNGTTNAGQPITESTLLSQLGISGKGTVTVTVGGRQLSVEVSTTTSVGQLANNLEKQIREEAAKQGFVELSDFELQQYEDSQPPTYRVVGVNIPIRFALSTNGQEVAAADVSSPFGTYTEGQNAKLTINGVEVERNSNSFTYEGHTLELQDISTEAITVETTRDATQAKEAIKKFVEAYNELNEHVYGLLTEDATHREYAPLTEAQEQEMTEKQVEMWEEKAKGGLLRGDTLLQKLQSQMRSTVYQKSDSSDLALYNIGIDTSFYTSTPGNLVLDESKLEQMLIEDPEGVRNLFADADTGLAYRFNQVIESATKVSTGTPGYLYAMAGAEGTTDTTSTIYYRMKDINETLQSLAARYEQQYDRYWAQFNSMESQLNDLSAQSSWLLSQFSSTNSY